MAETNGDGKVYQFIKKRPLISLLCVLLLSQGGNALVPALIKGVFPWLPVSGDTAKNDDSATPQSSSGLWRMLNRIDEKTDSTLIEIRSVKEQLSDHERRISRNERNIGKNSDLIDELKP